MKALHFIAALLFISSLTKAQDEKGIKFEKGLNWEQIREKAKKENKYIFLDGFTTWCGPCKQMTKEIFPQESVGKFFNENFINVAVQFDVTKKDNQEVKSWYKDATAIKKTYKIESYPTYLFFSPQGELVHSIYSAVPDGLEFIRLAKEAIDPKKQFLSLKRQYEAGNKDPDFLYSLLVSTLINREQDMTAVVATAYLTTEPNLLTKNNLKILPRITKKTSDPGFNIFLKHAKQADSVLGKGQSAEMVKVIIFDEIILPVLRIGGKRIDYGMMYGYSGELSKTVDWDRLKVQLDLKYPDLSEELLLSAKLTYLDWCENWSLLNKTIYNSLITDNNSINSRELKTLANRIFMEVDDKSILEETINWAKLNLVNLANKTDKLNFMVIYAKLLEKAGRKHEAIKQLETAVELTNGKEKYFIDILEKMKASKSIAR